MIEKTDIIMVASYLRERYHLGNRYHKAKDIGNSLGIPTKKIPCILQQIKEQNTILIEKWSKHSYRIIGVN
jgi:hypothetical protein